MSAPDGLHQLVERFEQHLEAYKSGNYNEAQLRQEFLDPFFKLLGWDMDNSLGYRPYCLTEGEVKLWKRGLPEHV